MIRFAFEFKLEDLWIGLYWRSRPEQTDVWICLLPCLPFHVEIDRRCTAQGFVTKAPNAHKIAAPGWHRNGNEYVKSGHHEGEI